MDAEIKHQSSMRRAVLFWGSLLATLLLMWASYYGKLRLDRTIAVFSGPPFNPAGEMISPDDVQFLDFDREDPSPRWFRELFLPLMKFEELLRGLDGNSYFWEDEPATCLHDSSLILPLLKPI
jgi:hypothetical protein